MKKYDDKGDVSRISLNLGDFNPPTGYRTGSGHQGHQKSFTSTREAIHHDHKIKIKTTYRIEIDSEPLTMHTVVTNDGRVHHHGLPNYAFTSAIDMAKSIIDASRSIRIVEDELDEARHDGGHGSDDDTHGNHGGHH